MNGVEEGELNFEPVVTRKAYLYHPRNIRYTQDSINASFSDGKSLVLTLHWLRTGEIKPESIPNIRVFVRDRLVYSLDNRRLWLFKQLNKEIPIDVVQYDPRFDAKITTTSGGETIKIRRFKGKSSSGFDEEDDGDLNKREVSFEFKRKVLSWAQADILNDDLYEGKLPLLPEIFDSSEHYFHCFKPHVLEEVRAQLKQSIVAYDSAPRAEISIQRIIRPQPGEMWEIFASIRIIQPEDHNLQKANDILLICERPGEVLYRAITVYHVTAQKEIRFNTLTFEYTIGQQLTAYWVGNITTPMRINYALRNKSKRLRGYLPQLVEPYLTHFKADDMPTAIPLKLNQYINSRFNLSQQVAIRNISAATSKDIGNGLLLLQGPPGTGKTTTIIGALSVLVARGVRVLVCSSSNHAVDEIARKVATKGLIGKDGEPVNPFVVLVGNEDNIDLSGGLENIFIDNLVKNMHKVNGKLLEVNKQIDEFFTAADTLERYVRAEVKHSKKTMKSKNEPPAVIDFVSKAVSSWVSSLQLWLTDAQPALVPSIYERYKQAVTSIIQALKNILAVLVPNNLDAQLAPTLVGFIQNRQLPAAISKNASIGAKKFYENWVNAIQGVRAVGKLNMNSAANLEALVVEEAMIVFSTVSTCGSFVMHKVQFEIGIIDEAGQCVEAETLIAMGLITNRCVLVGDPQQLPSTVISQKSQKLHFGRSMMGRMMECKHPALLLDVQYRMHPDISDFPNRKFYYSKIRDGDPVKQADHAGKWHLHPLFPTYAFYDIKGTEERNIITRSLFNTHEVNAIGFLISNLLQSYPETSHASIGVITPYREQLNLITKQLHDLYPSKVFEIATIDGFQGREMDIIIFSAVRANWSNDLGFVRDYHRLNVAITRARYPVSFLYTVSCIDHIYSLWILGHSDTLGNDAVWKHLIQDAKARGRFLTQENHKITINAKVAVTLAIDSVEKPTTTKRRPLFEDAPWQVILSNRACDSIRKIIAKQQDVKKLFERLLWLAQGNRPKSYLSFKCSDFAHDLLFEYKLNSGQTIIWTIDIDRFHKRQILKVWDILPTPDRIPDAVRRIEQALLSYSQPYIDLCKMKLGQEELILPLTFSGMDLEVIPTLAEVRQADKSGGTIVVVQAEKAAVEEAFLLMKFFPLSSHLARMLAVGNDIEIPFQLSPEETELVKFPMSSLFILGRSGTGKTTVLVFRMFSIQQAYQNSVLADIASQISGEDSHVGSANKNNTGKNGEDKNAVIKQLFVTASPKLCASIRDYYTKLHIAIKPDYTLNKSATPDDDMMDEDEETAILANVPSTLALVTEADCPLILTFTKLLSMIDNSFSTPFLKEQISSSVWNAEGGNLGSMKSGNVASYLTANDEAPKSKRKEVDFWRFSEVYYKHFDQRLTDVVDAATVFMQIMSFIKGSAEAMNTTKGCLTYQAYLDYPPKKCPLAHSKREIVYKLFEKYEAMRLDRNDYDQCDYVFYVIRQLRHNEVLPTVDLPKINFVYIDEVQDLTQAQLLLFSLVCNNLKGFVFAGDTAQTIARGVGFRFEDIRSLYYTEFGKQKEQPPELHHLSQNFRTHSGICNIASSVVEPLIRFFPESIDKLKRETALVAGDCPIFIQIQGFKEIFFHMFGQGNKVRVEFGAEQAIIVRDQAAKERLLKEITSGLVLTIYEAKGLEFKSVLLFNFWKDSPAKNTWRVIYQYMAEKNIGNPENYPEFSSERFSALCNELKQLYVGVTRTRQDLFIFDEDEKTHQPMLDYWAALGYISSVSSMDHPAVANLAQKSDPEKWQSEGKRYFQSRNYELALRCFINSGNEFFQLWTMASILRGQGEQLLNIDKPHEAFVKFNEAAETYLKAHVHPEKESDKKLNLFAANLFIRCNELTKAGDIFYDELDYAKAGDCYSKAKKFEKAANAFEKANMIPAALDCCQRGLWELGRDIVARYQANNKVIDSSTTEKIYNFLRAGALHFHSLQNNEKTLLFVHMFEPTSQRRKFLIRYGYVEELVKVEIAEGNFSKVGDIYSSYGKYEEASEYYVSAKELNKAATCLLQQAKAQEITSQVQATEATKKLNANATSFVPISSLLNKAKAIVENAENASRTLFDIDLMLAKKNGDLSKLVSLLATAQNSGYVASELDILLYVLPAHINNTDFPLVQLLEEGKRVRMLGLEMLDTLSAAEMNKYSLSSAKMKQVEEFFQVQPHPNPEMRTVQRIDYLEKTDFKATAGRSGQLEARRDVFLSKAIAFLGRKMVSAMIGVVGRYYTNAMATATDQAVAIFNTINFGKEIMNILNMSHLRFNVTLLDLRKQFDANLTRYLLDFVRIYYPAVRTIRAPYIHFRRKLESAPSFLDAREFGDI